MSDTNSNMEVEAGPVGEARDDHAPFAQLLRSQRADDDSNTEVEETSDDKWARIEETRDQEQGKAIEAAKAALMQDDDESRRALVVMACGTGKTHVFISTADEIASELVMGELDDGEGEPPPIKKSQV